MRNLSCCLQRSVSQAISLQSIQMKKSVNTHGVEGTLAVFFSIALEVVPYQHQKNETKQILASKICGNP